MLGTRIAAALALALIVVAGLACGGGSGGDGDTDRTPSPQASATRTPSGSETPAIDEKTPIADQTPAGSTSGAVDEGTPRPTAQSGTLAVAPEDQTAFASSFADESPNLKDCQFNPATSATDCGEYGVYRVDPVLKGQDVSCQIGTIDGVPVLIICGSQQPLTTIWYEIQQ